MGGRGEGGGLADLVSSSRPPRGDRREAEKSGNGICLAGIRRRRAVRRCGWLKSPCLRNLALDRPTDLGSLPALGRWNTNMSFFFCGRCTAPDVSKCRSPLRVWSAFLSSSLSPPYLYLLRPERRETLAETGDCSSAFRFRTKEKKKEHSTDNSKREN